MATEISETFSDREEDVSPSKSSKKKSSSSKDGLGEHSSKHSSRSKKHNHGSEDDLDGHSRSHSKSGDDKKKKKKKHHKKSSHTDKIDEEDGECSDPENAKKEKKKKSSKKSKQSENEDVDDEEAAKRREKRREERRQRRKSAHSDDEASNENGEEAGEAKEKHRKSKSKHSSSKSKKEKSHRHRHHDSDNEESLEEDQGVQEETKDEGLSDDGGETRHRHHDKKSKKKKKDKDKDKDKDKAKKEKKSKNRDESSSKHKKKSSSRDKNGSSGQENEDDTGSISDPYERQDLDRKSEDHVNDEDEEEENDDVGFGVRTRDAFDVFNAYSPSAKDSYEGKSNCSSARSKNMDDLEEHDLDEDAIEEEGDDGSDDDEGAHHSGGYSHHVASHLFSGMDDVEQSAWNKTLPTETRDDLYVDEFSSVQDPSQEMTQRILKLRKLLYGPVPEGVTLKAQIDRHYDNSGNVYYSFILPVERGDGLRDKRMTLMIAKCRSGFSLKPTYVISLEPIDFKKRCSNRSERYFGKVQLIKGADALGLAGPMQYVLYDDGYNPNRVGGLRGEPPVGFGRKMLASVIFEDTKGISEDMNMTVAIPKISHLEEKDIEPSMDPIKTQFKTLARCHNFSVQERVMESEEDLEHHPFLDTAENTFISVNKIPMGSKKRLAISNESRFPVAPSIKNFEVSRAPVAATSNPELGLARIGKERFFVLARYPFSPFEAFGICIAKFDAANSYRSKLGRRFSL